MNSERVKLFRKTIFDYYRKHGRDELPWRQTEDPYKILVSEVMLQQTQVDRVVPYYRMFVRAYPNVRKLAKAPLADVLRLWQGLGYNRRAKMLHSAAKQIVEKYGAQVPKDAAELESIWGIGPYTAHAVAAFAYNHDAVFVETNIRTAVIYHFFPRAKEVSDGEIFNVLKKTLPHGKSRIWYSALMDYGAALKRSGVKTNARVKGYKKQSRFDGSYRQARGAILRALAEGPLPSGTLTMLLGREREEQIKGALASLTKEGIIALSRGTFRLAD
jgi:A/G-specific adenine glycosylase